MDNNNIFYKINWSQEYNNWPSVEWINEAQESIIEEKLKIAINPIFGFNTNKINNIKKIVIIPERMFIHGKIIL
jgi:hypothetical protein